MYFAFIRVLSSAKLRVPGSCSLKRVTCASVKLYLAGARAYQEKSTATPKALFIYYTYKYLNFFII